MYKIIDGKEIAERIQDELAAELSKDKSPSELINSRRPNLAIILVGNREDSALYVSMKEKEAKSVGIDTHLYKCEEDVTEADLLDTIKFLNADDEIDAILVQLPLPKHINTDMVVASLDPKKDVDRFHPENLKIMEADACNIKLLPPVYLVVKEMLKDIGFDAKEKYACVIANSDIFGSNLKKTLECLGMKAVEVHPNDPELEKETVKADLLVTAIGRPYFITKDMVKEGAVVIDIGISNLDGKVVGDVDFEDVKDKCSYITPVPGGVGPLTIAMTFKNVVEMFKGKRSQQLI